MLCRVCAYSAPGLPRPDDQPVDRPTTARERHLRDGLLAAGVALAAAVLRLGGLRGRGALGDQFGLFLDPALPPRSAAAAA